MDPLQLNQARQFIIQNLIVLVPIFGADRFQDFYSFFHNQLSQSQNPTWESLQLLVSDRGRLFELMSALSPFEKSQIPCQVDLYHHPTLGLATRFSFHQANKAILERFLDHLSCFAALYMKDQMQNTLGDMLLLSLACK